MKKSYLIFIIFFIAFSIITKIFSQTTDKPVEYHFSTTIFDEQIAIPFEARKDAPTHLGVALAVETNRKREGIYQFTHVFQAGYYYHKDFNQVAFLAWKPKFELRFAKLINIHVILGFGYAHSFPVRQNYELDNGSYKKKTSWGKPHAMPSVGFGAGIHLEKVIGLPMELFGRYETFSLAPYALKGRVPITINTMLSFGLKCKI